MRIGDSAEEQLADRTEATVGSPTARAETTERVAGLRGEQVMTNRQPAAPIEEESSLVRSCWMCGIRLPAHQMVADGGSACLDLRWYCRDTWGCTRRWTSHSARLAAIRPDKAAVRPDKAAVRPGKAETSEPPGEQAEGLAAARRVAV
jgi:hypothetical protein